MPSVAGKNRGTANTNAIWHGGKLLILKEDSLPWEVDPDTLETIREWDYDGAVKAVSLTAHPKLDLETGELLTFSYQAKGDATTDVAFYVIDKHGKVAHEMWFNAPWAPMVHDFAVTETHVVIPFFPLATDLEVIKKGGPFYQWHGDRQTVVAVFPRRGRADEVRWFRGPTDQRRPYDERDDGGFEAPPRSLPLSGQLLPVLPDAGRQGNGAGAAVPVAHDLRPRRRTATGTRPGSSRRCRAKCRAPTTAIRAGPIATAT